jgi:NAD(P)-dependent dehydrogenase (short-subunit alcohol dehydrogenase family)
VHDDVGIVEAATIIDRFRLDGKVAIITGASSGLGVAFAEGFADAGAQVVLGARRDDRLREVAARIEAAGGEVETLQTDVAQPGDCHKLAEAAQERFGRVDVLINNAGVALSVPASRETPEQFRAVLDVNLHGSYWMAQAAARHMAPGSSIVNVASVLAIGVGHLPQAAYAASKAGVLGLTRDLANQWTRRKGIRVNALAPGYFPTEMTEGIDEDEGANHLQKAIMERMGRPDELAAAAIFLASDASSFITGVTLPVDGGWTIR